MKNHKSQWNSIALRNIPVCSSTIGLIKSFHQSGLAYSIVDKMIACPTLIIQNRESEAQHILNKYSIKRPYNYFKKSGDLRHEALDSNQTIDEHIDTFFKQHINRWQNTSTPSLFLSENNTAFYRILSKRLLNNNQLLFSLVTLNNKPLAYHFGFEYNNVVTWYKPSFDIQYAKHSPGTLMARYLIDYCLTNKKKELDFTIGNEPFKGRFTNLTRQNVNVRIFSHRLVYYLFFIKLFFKNTIKKLIGRQ
jgi:hypothetical protein